jgi:acyl carrier protein
LLGFAIDSLRMIDIMLSAEEEFEIQFQRENLDHIRTIGELADHIDRLISKRNAGKVTIISGANV